MADVNTQIVDIPSKLHGAWSGYFNYKERTMLPTNVVTYPSKNFFMPDNDRAIARMGSKVLGQEATEDDYGIMGRYKKFATLYSQVLEVRVYQTSATGAKVEALWTDPDTGIAEWVFVQNIVISSLPDVDGGGVHVYMDEWFDNTAFKPRLIVPQGTAVTAWTGAIVKIGAVGTNTLTTLDGATWASYGFDGTSIIVNKSGGGVATLTVVSGNDTDTITVDDSTGISVGDIAVDSVQVVGITGDFQAHFAKTIKNHVVYGDFNTRLLKGSNATNYESTAEQISFAADLDDMTITDGDMYVGSTIQYVTYVITSGDPTSPNQYSAYVSDTPNGSGSVIALNVDVDTPLVYNGVSMQVSHTTGHTTGDKWQIRLTPAVTQGYADFTESTIRLPGQAFTFYVHSNFFTMEIQEDNLYLCDVKGQWSYLDLVLSADLLTESVIVQPLKQTTSSRPIFPYMVGYMDNYLCYVTDNKTLDFIGRKKFLELPQIGYLSDPVKLDFLRSSFVGGGIEFWDKKLFITSPAEVLMHCYDYVRKYWQPPQEFPEAGLLSIVDNSLIAHSDYRNQTNTLFTGTNDNGDAFTFLLRTGYNAYGNRWNAKNFNMTFIEGRIKDRPTITLTVYLIGPKIEDPIISHIVYPTTALNGDTASIGAGTIGSQPIGSGYDTDELEYFKEVYKGKTHGFEFASMEIVSSTLNLQLMILSTGLNAVYSRMGNNDWTNPNQNNALLDVI